MLRITLVLLSFLLIQSSDYRSVFSDDYDNALHFMGENTDKFMEFSKSYDTDPEIIMSVLFPEAIRFSIVSNYLETKSLELAYVYAGSTDFSIGYFQMKPSFVENIENTIIKYQPELNKYDTLLIPSYTTLPEIRKERINRLKNLDYQVLYANCLFDVIRLLYPEIFNADKATQIKFISTAFNHGFLTGKDEITEYLDKAFFPMAGKNNTERYVYNEISLYFYINDLPKIVSKLE